MELFDPAGHLTDGALLALAHEEVPDELARLEMAEHLAYCDQCLHRYTALLAEAPLLTPAHSCRESLWRRVRARTLRILTSRYATAAAAAVALALTVVWGSGRIDLIRRPILPEDRPSVSEGLRNWSARWSDSLAGALSRFNDMFDDLGGTVLRSAQGGNP